MSRYGPPDGPYDAYADPTGRIPPREQDQPRDPYEPPSDPWGGNTDPQWAYSPPASTPGWDGPTDEPPDRASRHNTVLYAAVTVLVIVVAGAVGYALYLLSGENAAPAAGPTESAAVVSPEVTGANDDTGSPTPGPTPGPTQDTTGQAASRAQAGDCLVNNGTNDEPQMQIVACDDEVDAPVYEVLERVNEPVDGDDPAAQNLSAQQTCEGVDGYTHHYFEKGDLVSFVLCMREA